MIVVLSKRKPAARADRIVLLNATQRVAKGRPKNFIPEPGLHVKLPLGIDATLRYALSDWTKPLTTQQLALRSPYNTRRHGGLPPTPIGNPGLASLRAAASCCSDKSARLREGAERRVRRPEECDGLLLALSSPQRSWKKLKTCLSRSRDL